MPQQIGVLQQAQRPRAQQRPGRRPHENPEPVLVADAVGAVGAQVGVEAVAQGVGQRLAY